MSLTPCRHGDPLEVDEAPVPNSGDCGASKETGPPGSIVAETFEYQHPQRNMQQHPQVGGDTDVAQTTTTSSSSSWRLRRTPFDMRTPVIDLDKAGPAISDFFGTAFGLFGTFLDFVWAFFGLFGTVLDIF